MDTPNIPETSEDDLDDQIFRVYPEGIVLLEQDGVTDAFRVCNVTMLPDVMVSLAYGLDHGDDPSQWGTPIALSPDHKVTYLGEALVVAERVADASWFPKYLDLFVASLPFKTCGVLPFIRAARTLNALRKEVSENDVAAAILAAKNDWLARVDAAAAN